jgi:hypothetical protein
MDQIWYFNNGHNAQIQLYSPSNSCNQYLLLTHALELVPWSNYGQHPRVQMTWGLEGLQGHHVVRRLRPPRYLPRLA